MLEVTQVTWYGEAQIHTRQSGDATWALVSQTVPLGKIASTVVWPSYQTCVLRKVIRRLASRREQWGEML